MLLGASLIILVDEMIIGRKLLNTSDLEYEANRNELRDMCHDQLIAYIG